MPEPQQAAPGWPELVTDSGHQLLSRIAEQGTAGVGIDRISRDLRAEGVDPAFLAAALTQTELRAKAAAKFGPLADAMLFTRAGLEQATRAPVADLHAARFAEAGCRVVADLGCGLGAESLALIRAGSAVSPVELDPLTAAYAAHNLGVQAEALEDDAAADPRLVDGVRVGDAEKLGAGAADGVFLDPARRTAGHSDTRRIASPDDYSPTLGFAFSHASRVPTGVKLGPGLDRDLIPETAEAQWVSVDGQLVETALWFGAVARPGIRRAALVLRSSGRSVGAPSDNARDHAVALESAELTAASDASDADVRELGEYLYEPDGAVIRARLIGLLAEQLGAGMASPGIAYLTGDRLAATPFAQSFRVLEQLPAREKDLRRALSSRDIGSLEIKKRGSDVDPAALRKRLKLSGNGSATLFMTRNAEGRHIALLAERV